MLLSFGLSLTADWLVAILFCNVAVELRAVACGVGLRSLRSKASKVGILRRKAALPQNHVDGIRELFRLPVLHAHDLLVAEPEP